MDWIDFILLVLGCVNIGIWMKRKKVSNFVIGLCAILYVFLSALTK